tara:strand:- start:53 stop:610 length:558 start_codon:yes stop_codon:yes gene_type:complete
MLFHSMSVVFLMTACSVANSYDLYLDGDSPETGSELGTSFLITEFGSIAYTGELLETNDIDLINAGSEGNVFDIVWSSHPAFFLFDFDVESITFIYGGNSGGFMADVRDQNGFVIDSFFQANTDDGFPAGAVTLSGTGIRGFYWNDTDGGGLTHAAVDNIQITVPVPASLSLLAMSGLVGISRKR